MTQYAAYSRLLFFALMLFGLIGRAQAKVKVIAEYRLADDKNHELKREGNPRIVASSPATPAARGAASLEFDGKQDACVRSGALFGAADRFGMEVWVKAGEESVAGLKGVVANGTGSRGYVLGQSENRWVAFVGCVGAFDIGPVTAGQWTHLAMVNDGRELALYLNGEKVGRAALSPAVESVFRIGTAALPEEHFKGLIHVVRVFTFEPGQFDPDKDFLLDNALRQKMAQQKRDEQSAYIQRVCTAQPGVSMVKSLDIRRAPGDWLIAQPNQPVQLQVEPAGDGQSARLALCNGLISRTFVVSGNLACVSMRGLANQGFSSEAEFLRTVQPEARVMLDGTWYEIGGLKGQPEMAFLMADWIKGLKANPRAFRFTGVTTAAPEPRYPWKPAANAAVVPWPTKGLHVIMNYDAPVAVADRHKGVKVQIHYEMYEGTPIMAKWLTLTNDSGNQVVVDQIETEILAVAQDMIKRLDVESNYSFALANVVKEGSVRVHFPGGDPKYFGGSTTQWSTDPAYGNWATQNAAEDIFLGFPHICLLKSRIPLGPAELVKPGGTFESHITFELLQDSFDRERQSLGHRRMYRTLCPQVTEHLLMVCATSTDPASLKKLFDQAGELGFERIDIGPWIGFRVDTESAGEIAKWKDLVAYAHAKGIQYVGGYELMVSSRDRGPLFDTINPATGKPGSVFGQSGCWASQWVDPYYKRLWNFLDKTGMSHVAVDGCYHGDPCASTSHQYHRGLEDSQWMQWKKMGEYFKECMRRNTIAPAPDWYFFNGATCTGMGYREGTENLPYEQQLLMARQFIYDGTWYKAPTMGWIATPVGGKSLSKVLPWYEGNLAQGLGSGAQWGLYGMQIYDTEETKASVKKWVGWFKKYHAILTSDIIHVRRPDGRDIDCILHVNPQLKEKGLVMFFNPLGEPVTRKVSLPLYYTGLTDTAWIREQEQAAKPFKLSRDYRVEMEVTVPPRGVTWYVIGAER